MKTYRLTLLPALLGVLGTFASVRASSFTFDNTNTAGLQDGGGNWNTTTANWWNGSADVAWPNLNTDEAVFGVSSTGANNTVNVSAVTAGKITFTALSAGNYQLLGGTITLAGTGASIVANNTAGNGAIIRSTLIASSGFTKSGAGTLSFGAGADLSGVGGSIDLSGGNVFVTPTTGGSAAAAWTISSSGTNLGLGANGTFSLGSLSGVTGSVLRTAGAFNPTASIGALNTDTTFSGNITGTIAITKVGTGKLTLAARSNANNYTGATTISAGTLALDTGGSINKTTAITVASGATYDVSAVSGYILGATAAQTLKGSGTVNGAVTIAATNGTLLAGDAGTAGTLTFNHSLTLAGTTGLDLIGVTAGTYDTLSVGGALTAGGVLQLVVGSNFATTLANAGGSASLALFNGPASGTFASITLTGLDTGSFLTTTAGSSFTGGTSGITYTWVGDGTLAVSSIPEPSAGAVILGLAALAGTGFRHRRRRAG